MNCRSFFIKSLPWPMSKQPQASRMVVPAPRHRAESGASDWLQLDREAWRTHAPRWHDITGRAGSGSRIVECDRGQRRWAEGLRRVWRCEKDGDIRSITSTSTTTATTTTTMYYCVHTTAHSSATPTASANHGPSREHATHRAGALNGAESSALPGVRQEESSVLDAGIRRAWM